MGTKFFIILGNQLFEPDLLKALSCQHVFMSEDFGLCTYEQHHKLKIYLFLTAMREYRDELRANSIGVDYFPLETRVNTGSYAEFLLAYLLEKKIYEVDIFEIEDKDFEVEILDTLSRGGILVNTHSSPMFIVNRDEFSDFFAGKKEYRLANFYKSMRQRKKFLVTDELGPIGGKWSFDEDNRKKIPKGTTLPIPNTHATSKYDEQIKLLIERFFSSHPGGTSNVWFPVTRVGAINHLESFLDSRLKSFGVFEDAMVSGENFLFHSTISPLLNIGLLTPEFVIEAALKKCEDGLVPLNSIEGFVRQILGWREFIRGIYQCSGDKQRGANFWGHTRALSSSWYDGSTGISPLDDNINLARRDGYAHHIPRLMVISNLMNLCEVDPNLIYKWFMEMFIDASDWVMVPNVYGMATFADGGMMSTKPYTCGSNYILKMSNYKRGHWCETVDGLYWRFVEKNSDFYKTNPRLSFQLRMLEKMSVNRKSSIFDAAERFLATHTC